MLPHFTVVRCLARITGLRFGTVHYTLSVHLIQPSAVRYPVRHAGCDRRLVTRCLLRICEQHREGERHRSPDTAQPSPWMCHRSTRSEVVRGRRLTRMGTSPGVRGSNGCCFWKCKTFQGIAVHTVRQDLQLESEELLKCVYFACKRYWWSFSPPNWQYVRLIALRPHLTRAVPPACSRALSGENSITGGSTTKRCNSCRTRITTRRRRRRRGFVS